MTTLAETPVVPTFPASTTDALLELRKLTIEYGIERPARAARRLSRTRSSRW
jgi:hypothetical protein